MKFLHEDFRRHVGLALSALRREKGYTQEQVAERAQLDRNYISEIERGLKMPTLDSIFRVAHALRIKPSSLVSEIEVYEKPL